MDLRERHAALSGGKIPPLTLEDTERLKKQIASLGISEQQALEANALIGRGDRFTYLQVALKCLAELDIIAFKKPTGVKKRKPGIKPSKDRKKIRGQKRKKPKKKDRKPKVKAR